MLEIYSSISMNFRRIYRSSDVLARLENNILLKWYLLPLFVVNFYLVFSATMLEPKQTATQGTEKKRLDTNSFKVISSLERLYMQHDLWYSHQMWVANFAKRNIAL